MIPLVAVGVGAVVHCSDAPGPATHSFCLSILSFESVNLISPSFPVTPSLRPLCLVGWDDRREKKEKFLLDGAVIHCSDASARLSS